jgi:ABC-type glycerol-3-phosphate transport system substrate-binding protein
MLKQDVRHMNNKLRFGNPRGETSWRCLAVRLTILACIAVGLLPHRSYAGSSIVTLSLNVPDAVRLLLENGVLQKFEELHPTIRVVPQSTNPAIPSTAASVDEHLEAAMEYTTSADVVYVETTLNNNSISPAATRYGLFLNLEPLIGVDTAFTTDTFYPAVQRAFVWDDAVWALPAAINIVLFSYAPELFDTSGILYPTRDTQQDEFWNAVRVLTEKNAENTVVRLGLNVFPGAEPFLLQSLSDETLSDDDPLLQMPHLTGADTVQFFEQWLQLRAEGAVEFSTKQAAMSVAPADVLLAGGSSQGQVISLLPGGKAGLDVKGFAISAGTAYPEESYLLLKFLTSGSEVAEALNLMPASRGFPIEQIPLYSLLPDGLLTMVLEDEMIAMVPSDLPFADYFTLVIGRSRESSQQPAAVLEQIEREAIFAQSSIATMQPPVLSVDEPDVPSAENGGKNIRFGVITLISPPPTREPWDTLAGTFVDEDLEIDEITLDVLFQGGTLQEIATRYDCFYLPYNAIQEAQPGQLLDMQPLVNTDSSFSEDDIVQGVLSQFRRDSQLWGLPIVIEPAVLRYDVEQFAQAGISLLDGTWSTGLFSEVLRALGSGADTPPFVPGYFGGPKGTHLLILIASYGGVLLDYRSGELVTDFDSATSVEAIRAVLDLVNAGYIQYEPLGRIGGLSFGSSTRGALIYTDILNSVNFRQQPTATYAVVTYPVGEQFTGLAYDIGSAYISAQSSNPEACYRWISRLSHASQLFTAMPARRSLLEDPVLTAAQGADVVTLYRHLDALLQTEEVIPFPSTYSRSTLSDDFIKHWLFEAFDEYVLNDADLESVLGEAQAHVDLYSACVKDIPSSAYESMLSLSLALSQCAGNADEKLR